MNEIIHSMCMTWRHDYGLDKSQNAYPFPSGMTQEERAALWNQMKQLYDHHISHYKIYEDTIRAMASRRLDTPDDYIMMAKEAIHKVEQR